MGSKKTYKRAYFAPAVTEIREITDADRNELAGNATLTVGEGLVDHYFGAAGITRDDDGAYVDGNGDLVSWDRGEALSYALAVVATYR